MLRRAFEGDDVFVGVTNGPLAGRADRDIPAWTVRARAIEDFATTCGFQGALTVRALEDGIGPAATEDYDAIVVSPETASGAMRINELRKDRGLEPLAMWSVPHLRGEDRLGRGADRLPTTRPP